MVWSKWNENVYYSCCCCYYLCLPNLYTLLRVVERCIINKMRENIYLWFVIIIALSTHLYVFIFDIMSMQYIRFWLSLRVRFSDSIICHKTRKNLMFHVKFHLTKLLKILYCSVQVMIKINNNNHLWNKISAFLSDTRNINSA